MIIIRLVNSVFQIYGLIMLARVLISWFTDLTAVLILWLFFCIRRQNRC